MSVVIWVSTAMLTVAGVLALIRVAWGPTMLNRIVAMEVIVVVIVSAVGLEVASSRQTTTLPILVIVALVGFVGAVSVARFAAGDERNEP